MHLLWANLAYRSWQICSYSRSYSHRIAVTATYRLRIFPAKHRLWELTCAEKCKNEKKFLLLCVCFLRLLNVIKEEIYIFFGVYTKCLFYKCKFWINNIPFFFVVLWYQKYSNKCYCRSNVFFLFFITYIFLKTKSSNRSIYLFIYFKQLLWKLDFSFSVFYNFLDQLKDIYINSWLKILFFLQNLNKYQNYSNKWHNRSIIL